MNTAQFDFVRVLYAEEAVNVLAQYGDHAIVLAGGQSLIPQLSLRPAQPRVVIDLAQAADLRTIESTRDSVRAGAMVTHAAIEDGQVPDPVPGFLPYVAHGIAHRSVRNRATLGGSVCYADPCADWPTVVIALGAEIETLSPQGRRTIAAAEFFPAAFETALRPAEIVTALRFPRHSRTTRWGYYKVHRTLSESADAIVAVVHDAEQGFTRVILGGLRCPPVRLEGVEAEILAGRVSPDRFDLARCEAMLADVPAAVAGNLHNYAFSLGRAMRSAFAG
ncbi:Putative carbon monoxide dehydrogenase medium subunit, coxM-like protein [Rhodovulum sp. PH10]|uniref:FAD binding domain-containing protein n=1 Tax=Rhodovulum sp. PH10 TaxID=1187851 RepID=UPI00027C208D|nr:FAD binding domain-containing protein [Rhodovulum sp. PH10]EJW10378.1 Putative carbon monoxide dehydrogenase medium subunit, coxM-like protein [Rhodovulum sp. PH10]